MSDPEASSQQSGLVDLSDLKLMPDWVAGIGKPAKIEQKFRAYEERPDRGERRGGDRGRAGGGGGPPFRERGQEQRGRPGGPQEKRDRPWKGGPDCRDDRRGGPRHDRPEREPLPTDISVIIEPEDKAADALAAHIRATGRAFSMFDAAKLVLDSGDRHRLRLVCAAERAAGLLLAKADGAVFLSREEAVQHLLRSPALDQFYKAEEIELEEPKGEFKSMAVCGMSGELLGPPSHHSYQQALMRLHRERFPTLPFDEYKRRVRTESDPEIIAKWKEQQKKGVRWVELGGEAAEGVEPKTFASRAELEAHFRRQHSEAAVEEVREAAVPGSLPRGQLSQPLAALARRAVEGAKKHMFDFSQRLGSALDRRGLRLFKRRAGKLFVSRIRPRAIDPAVVFSERVQKIVEIIRQQPGIPISKLLDAAAPAPAAPESPPAESAEPPKLTSEQIGAMKDLRWLADEGYVIEYSDGAVFLGVQGEPLVQKPQPAAEQQEAAGSAEVPAADPAAEAEPVEMVGTASGDVSAAAPAVPPPAVPEADAQPAASQPAEE